MGEARKITGIILALMVIAFVFGIKDVNGATGSTEFNEWFEENEQTFQDQICEHCQERPDDPDDPDDPDEPKKKSKCDGSIGNLVWNDENENGIQDGSEKGLDDIKLKLKWAGEDDKWDTSDDEEDSTRTNSKGKYEFDDLCKGDYKVSVKESDVAGYTQVYDPDGTPNHKAKVELDSDKDHHTKADFGYKKRTTPATGSGLLALGLAAIASLFGIKQLRGKFSN